jgi:hypothetical protein
MPCFADGCTTFAFTGYFFVDHVCYLLMVFRAGEVKSCYLEMIRKWQNGESINYSISHRYTLI